MQYRKLPRGTEQISVLGIGTSAIEASSEKEIEKSEGALFNEKQSLYGQKTTIIESILKTIMK